MLCCCSCGQEEKTDDESLYGMEDGEKQERINREIEEWLKEEVKTGSLQGHYAEREEPASYTLYRATEQELIVILTND